ncbi:MAG TPA: AAA family ATPase [Ktedonobacteraceae bacterium]|nr:AAA family ATPase [Ktedonobacteraceae bacterium]
MITSLRLQNFKGFKDLEIADMSRITLFGGQNNIGKTALLEAIFLFYDTNNVRLLFQHMGWRGLNSALDFDTLFAPIFYDFDTKSTIRLTVQDDISSGSLAIRVNSSYTPKPISLNTTEGQNASMLGQTSSNVLTSNALTLRYAIVGQKEEETHLVVTQTPGNINIAFDPGPATTFPSTMQHPVSMLPLRVKVDPGEEAIRFGKVDVARKSDRILEFLKMLEPRLQGLSSVTLPHGPVMYAEVAGISRKIPVALLGDGINRLLSIILMIATSEKGIVLLDEIDAGLHHSILPIIWEEICKAAHTFHCQVIATTHSYECLQAAHDGVSEARMEQDFRYIRLDRIKATTIPKVYSLGMLGSALNRGWEVR